MGFPTRLLTCTLVLLAASSLLTISARKVEAKLAAAEEGTCWDALLELQSCSGEVVMFFLNGETQLGANCCTAITLIEHQCWPSMLGTLGITTEQTNLLRGYCHATASAPPTFDECYKFPRLQH